MKQFLDLQNNVFILSWILKQVQDDKGRKHFSNELDKPMADRVPTTALAQIEDRKYFEKFKIESNKPVVLVGMNFDYEDGNGVKINWKIKRK